MHTRKEVAVGYIEAKDIGVDLNSKSLKEQLDRLPEIQILQGRGIYYRNFNSYFGKWVDQTII